MSKPQLRFNYNDEWNIYPLSKVVNNISTGKLDANAAKKNGKYKFFTCSKEDFLTNTYSFDGDAVIINGNGDLGITKVYSGKFDAYQRTYVLMDFNQDFEYVGKAIPNYLPERLRTEAIGGAMPYIKMDTLEGLNIGIPSIDEQKDIASFLSNIDSLIEEKKNELEKTKQYKEAMLYKMFPKDGCKVPEIRFKGFDGEWDRVKLSSLVSMHARIGWQGLRKEEFLNKGNIYLITGTDFNKGKVNFKTCHYIDVDRFNQDINIQVKQNDVLITKDGTLGKVAYIDEIDKPATLNAGVFRIRNKNQNTYMKYLFQYLATDKLMNYAREQATGGTIKHLNQNILVDFPVLIPSKPEQVLIGDFFFELDEMINNKENEITILENYKATLLEKMFA